MSTPSMHGNPASSAAQQAEKSFPPDTAADVPVVSGLPGGVTAAGSPVFPEIRQDTPVAEMGTGYREAGEGDPS